MKVEKLNSLRAYQNASWITGIFSKAVRKAKETNRKNGLPNDFVIGKQRFYELPDGTITTENPLK
ncbi:MAG: hypothetical protein NZ455_12730 [Bacteroidia bacterium]|nr:hypothetical protein [Bacteroidia bacterium]MDW8346877.1 hypothetical protein [Bacteroidia bacterium]